MKRKKEAANDVTVQKASLLDADGKVVLTIVEAQPDAIYRIIACWNACSGITTKRLRRMPEGGVRDMIDELARLDRQVLPELRTKQAATEMCLRMCDRMLRSQEGYEGSFVQKSVRALLGNDPSLMDSGHTKH